MTIESIYRGESGRILATLIRLLGDFDAAEEAMQDAFAAALEQWPAAGTPGNPRGGLRGAGRPKGKRPVAPREAIPGEAGGDCPHRRARAGRARSGRRVRGPGQLDRGRPAAAHLHVLPPLPRAGGPDRSNAEGALRALDGRDRAGVPRPRADDGAAPGARQAEDPRCRDPVSRSARRRARRAPRRRYGGRLSDFQRGLRRDRRRHARPARVVRGGDSPGAPALRSSARAPPEARALLALLLLHDSRREARLAPDGEIVLLEEQDRSRWDQDEIREGTTLAELTPREGGPAPYSVQAAIAALHAEARRPEDTDWRQIAELYGVLLCLHPSPVVELNRAVAVAQVSGAEVGLRLLDDLDARGELRAYHLLPAARADLLRTLGRREEAAEAYRRALALVANEPERRFLERRLAEVED